MFHNNHLSHKLLILFPTCCLHLSGSCISAGWYFPPGFVSHCVGGWSPHRQEPLNSVPKEDLLPLYQLILKKETVYTQSGKIQVHFSFETGLPQYHNLSISETDECLEGQKPNLRNDIIKNPDLNTTTLSLTQPWFLQGLPYSTHDGGWGGVWKYKKAPRHILDQARRNISMYHILPCICIMLSCV